MAPHRIPARTVTVTFPCPHCGEPAQWSFPLTMLDEPGPHAFGAQCTECGHRAVTQVEIRDAEPVQAPAPHK